MNGQQVYELASAFLFEKDGDDGDSKRFAKSFINVMLAETYEIENSIRAAAGTEQLTSMPMLDALTDTIPYSDKLARVAFPYGMAYYFYKEAMDNYSASEYFTKYVDACNTARMPVMGSIKDVYGGDAE